MAKSKMRLSKRRRSRKQLMKHLLRCKRLKREQALNKTTAVTVTNDTETVKEEQGLNKTTTVAVNKHPETPERSLPIIKTEFNDDIDIKEHLPETFFQLEEISDLVKLDSETATAFKPIFSPREIRTYNGPKSDIQNRFRKLINRSYIYAQPVPSRPAPIQPTPIPPDPTIQTKIYQNNLTKGVIENDNRTDEVLPNLCVLCSKDIFKQRSKKSVQKFSDIVLRVTGVDISEYPIPPFSCGSCYKSLMTIKRFTKSVLVANVLITERLSHFFDTNSPKRFEFATFNTEGNVEINPPDIVDIAVKSEREYIEEETDLIEMDEDSSSSFRDESDISMIQDGASTEICTISQLIDDVCNNQQANGTQNSIPADESDECMVLCSVCGNRCSRDLYLAHVKSHPNNYVLCEKCNKSVSCKLLEEHLVMHETKKQPKPRKQTDKFICTQCGKLYSKINGLKIHEVTHGEKKHQCNICKQSFHFAHYLQRHMRSHSGEKPFACSYCNKTFSIIWNLHQHQRLHTNSKPYKCNVCSASFRHNVTLKGHLATLHTANEIAASNIETTVSSVTEGEKTSS